MKLSELDNPSEKQNNSDPMPVLFLGHGSPMNAIEENEFVSGFRKASGKIPRPAAILCISAHWETRGSMVTSSEKPSTIHDFSGFPPALYSIQYPAPGHPALAGLISGSTKITSIQTDSERGLDHGAWSVIKHLYPEADIPVIQLSLDFTKNPQFHYELGKELMYLRNKQVLIIGSGNMVHNLGLIDWTRMNETDYAYDWASEASVIIKNHILNDEHEPLIQYSGGNKSLKLAIPTPEHFLPLLYVLALKTKNDSINLFNDKAIGGSLTMTSAIIQHKV